MHNFGLNYNEYSGYPIVYRKIYARRLKNKHNSCWGYPELMCYGFIICRPSYDEFGRLNEDIYNIDIFNDVELHTEYIRHNNTISKELDATFTRRFNKAYELYLTDLEKLNDLQAK